MFLLYLIFCLICFSSGEQSSNGELHSTSLGRVLVSSIDGYLRALDVRSGATKWVLQEEPVLRAPNTVKQGFTFLPNPQDGSLYVLKEGSLKKLPFTIPQLVHASPCKGNDGVLYAGSKKDVWFGIDPATGVKLETLTSSTTERVCPANHGHAVFLGRTEYRVSMFDTVNTGKTWNATFSDYSAHLLPEDNTYSLKHYVSSSSGTILSVDISTGQILWERDLGSPVVAMYLLLDDGLHKLPFTVVGRETMENLVKTAYATDSWTNVLMPDSSQQTLLSSLYVGETSFGLYAIAALVDHQTITYAPKYLGPPLLEGPSPIALSKEEQGQFVPSKRPIVYHGVDSITFRNEDGEFLILGYHEPPPMHLGSIIPTRFPNIQIFPSITHEPGVQKVIRAISSDLKEAEKRLLSNLLYEIYQTHPWMIYGSTALIGCLVVVVVWICGKQSGVAEIVAEARSAQTSRTSNSQKMWNMASRVDDLPDGWMSVGKLVYNPADVLGRGCEGTVVFRGKFDGREVAVKRVVSEFVRLVDREADLLRESDTHRNVIRYYCMESDSLFRYLALELCVASLHDFVEEAEVRKNVTLTATEILKQTMDGLAHLHSADIVHRDIKPQNILISVQRGQARAVISDFGLCKRIQQGRQSLSRRSGLAGTDGWIAPEALFSESTSHPVDIFSMGCIFYYVLSEGKHPFGDNLHRQANIVNGEYNLRDIRDGGSVVISLIETMLQREPKERPTATSVLCHPFFWNAEKRLQFFGDVSDRVEKEEEISPLVRRLETNAKAVVCGGWRNSICQPLTEDLRKFRTYKSHSVRDLLRAMRNKKHHYRELPQEVRDSLGHIPEQYLHYWVSRFPMLLIHVYDAMEWCSAEPVFKGYYSDEVRIRVKDLVEQEEEHRKRNQDNQNAAQWIRGQVVSSSPKPSPEPKRKNRK